MDFVQLRIGPLTPLRIAPVPQVRRQVAPVLLSGPREEFFRRLTRRTVPRKLLIKVAGRTEGLVHLRTQSVGHLLEPPCRVVSEVLVGGVVGHAFTARRLTTLLSAGCAARWAWTAVIASRVSCSSTMQ